MAANVVPFKMNKIRKLKQILYVFIWIISFMSWDLLTPKAPNYDLALIGRRNLHSSTGFAVHVDQSCIRSNNIIVINVSEVNYRHHQ